MSNSTGARVAAEVTAAGGTGASAAAGTATGGTAARAPRADVAAVAGAAAAAVDPESLVELVRDAVRIPSVTGEESEFAGWVAGRLSAGGWDEVRRAEVAPGRPNVYGFAGAPDGGRSLVLAGHLDTVAVEDWRRHWARTDRADPFGAHVIDGTIWGRGVADQKAGICATIEALRALGRTGHRPGGGVTALFVCDEESGQPGSGVSAGMRAALGDVFGGFAAPAGDGARPAGQEPSPCGDRTEAAGSGPVAVCEPPPADARPPADFAIYTEPTTSAIYTAQMGFLIAEVALEGRSAYFGTPELGVDALRAGHALLSELWRHSAALGTGSRHELLGEAFLLVTSVSSGGNIAVPGRFELSLIRKVLPGEDLDEAAAAIRHICDQVAERDGVAAEVTFSAPRDHAVGGTPDEVPANHPGVVALSRSIESVTGHAARIEGAPYWSEKPFLHSLGIPGVYFAPGDISHCHTPFERLEIGELISATRSLAHFVASWCGVQKLQTTPV